MPRVSGTREVRVARPACAFTPVSRPHAVIHLPMLVQRAARCALKALRAAQMIEKCLNGGTWAGVVGGRRWGSHAHQMVGRYGGDVRCCAACSNVRARARRHVMRNVQTNQMPVICYYMRIYLFVLFIIVDILFCPLFVLCTVK